MPGCRQAKSLYIRTQPALTMEILGLSRADVKLIVNNLRDHCRLRNHLENLLVFDSGVINAEVTIGGRIYITLVSGFGFIPIKNFR